MNSEQANKIEGVFVIGTLIGFASEPWERNGRSGVNNRIGINRSFEDKWGQPSVDTIQIDVPSDAANKFREQVAQMKGQSVLVRVVPMAKAGGRNGAFLQYFAPKESNIIPLASLARVAAPSPK